MLTGNVDVIGITTVNSNFFFTAMQPKFIRRIVDKIIANGFLDLVSKIVDQQNPGKMSLN